MEDVTEMGYDDDAINDVYDKNRWLLLLLRHKTPSLAASLLDTV